MATALPSERHASVHPPEATIGPVEERPLPAAPPLRRILGPDVRMEWDSLPPVQTGFDGPLVAAMAAAVAAEDPGARLLPYLLPASTDAKSFGLLGIRHFGFTPLRLPPDLDFTALFHGVDERVPTEALHFGTRVLHHLLRTC